MLACNPESMRWIPIGLALLVAGCFNPDKTPLESDSATATDTADTGGVCQPGETQVCTCDDGTPGTEECRADGTGFGTCACAMADDSTTVDPTSPPPECERDVDCADMAEGECEEGRCSDEGTCVVQPRREGTPCGDPAVAECSGADICDGAGTCSANDAADGAFCLDCPLGACTCTAGTCGDCLSFATGNAFTTARSVQGWELTGGWRLYREAPQSFQSGPTVFGSQVLGTDGNRVEPYPGLEHEQSSVRTSPMILPASLELLSWHVDEGSIDRKQIRVSNDGGATFVTLAECEVPGAPQPFCQFRSDERAPDDWDTLSLPLPDDMVGDLGIVELTYDTQDGCCNFEKGWFIDVTNLATECACVDDETCGGLGGECGTGVCGGTGECALDAVAAGTACGDATDVDCDAADACDGLGYCAPHVAATGLTSCSDCAAGPGGCSTCQAGACFDCMSSPSVNDFNAGTLAHSGWLIEDLSGTGADWRIYFSPPPNLLGDAVPLLSLAPSFGSDGNRQEPYPGQEHEHSRVTTTPDLVPPLLTFASWNVDEGGASYDTKRIELSVDGGLSWTQLIDCTNNPLGMPFCEYRESDRLGNDWDLVEIPTGPLAGQVGQLRITYDTGDDCCDFERGWFIDNLNFAQYCLDPQFP